jgi:hypothetical protein
MNLCGPFSTPLLSGSKHFVTFTNDYNRKTWVQFLKKKLNTLSTFNIFKNEVKRRQEKQSRSLDMIMVDNIFVMILLHLVKIMESKDNLVKHAHTPTKWD